MKKLMIALGAVMMAVCAHAYAVNWQWNGTIYNGYKNTSGTTTYTGKAAQGGDVYIFNANQSGITQQAILTAFLAGTALSDLGAMDSYTTSDGKMATAQKFPGDLGDSAKFSPTRTSGSTHYADYFYAMVVTDGTKSYLYLSESGYTAIQTAKDTLVKGNVQNPSMVNQGESTTFTAGGWYAAAPEPTSGLLLLLGMAGLALKRKRA